MEKEQVVYISDCIEKATSELYKIEKLDHTVKNFLPGFQKGKEALSGFNVTSLNADANYIFTFIHGHNDENYYLVIYSGNKKAMAELKKVEVIDNDSYLVWKYNPLKRDGKNQERKDYFKETFGPLNRQIPLPKSHAEIEAFFNQLFALCHDRLEADNIGEGIKS